MRSGALERTALSGLALAATEVALVLVHDRGLFLSDREVWRYVGLAFGTCVTLALAAVTVGRALAADARRGAWGTAVLATACAGAVLWLTSEGRRLRDLPGRAVAVCLLAIAVGVCAAWLARALQRRQAGGASLGTATLAFGAVALGALVVDAWALRRLYPAFHAALAVIALGAACLAFGSSRRLPSVRASRAAALAVLAAGASLPWQIAVLARAPNARFAIEQSAPLTGKLLRATRERVEELPAGSPIPPVAPDLDWDDTGIDLRGRDVLVVSIDALRADRLRALGGTGGTPRLDAFAEQAVVFRHAYTTTPHTSYALTGLLTAKYVGELARLDETSVDHVTLPDLLRAHGVRTAAFYPPAIFFVDERRFEALAERRFGFEYTKRMFAPAHARTEQVARYLASAPRERPVFVWVHLFEPHEPYEPIERFARGDAPVERYDGEVATADDAAGAIIELFRRERPGATVVVLADHGEELGDHGGYHHGTTLHEEQVRIPLVWSSPGLAPRVVDAPVETVDVATTLLAALGIPRDARMRGDDLGPLLAGRGTGPAHAFASIGEERMVTDGRYKAICPWRGACRLFDLDADPRERDDLAVREMAVLARLRSVLSEHVGSMPRFEVLAMPGGAAWPEALARARLGDETAALEVVALLGDPRAEVRAAAARVSGELGVGSARIVLVRMRDEDADATVRAEAALASWRLGDRTRVATLRALLAEGDAGDAFVRRVALALAGADDAAAAPVLRALALDASAEETERLAAVRALGRVGGREETAALAQLLSDVRLRVEAARALGALGDATAVEPLVAALDGERYPEARAAEARALLDLGAASRAVPLVRRFLGTPSGVPGGVGLLLDAGVLRPSGVPELSLGRSARGAVRVVVRVEAERAGRIELAGEGVAVEAGTSEVAFTVAQAREARTLPIGVEGTARVVAVAVVPVSDDVPPPPPVPWSPDAGAP